MQPMISVIMLAYNHERYIAQAINSILEQDTIYDYEVIIGEDCSTDNTRNIIRQFAEKYPGVIKPIYNKKNLGTTKNVYRCYRAAKGKYLAACEGDDYWCDVHRLQREIDFLETHKEYVGINGKIKLVDEEGKIIPVDNVDKRLRFWEFEGKVYTISDYEKWLLPGHGSALTRRNVYLDEKLDYRITYKASSLVGDRTSMLINLTYGNIYCSDDVVSCYRLRMNQSADNFMSKSKYLNLRDKDFVMMCRLEEWCKKERKMNLDLSAPKRERLVGSVVVWMKSPTLDNFKVIKNIIIGSKTPLRYIGYSILVWIKKMYYWHIVKTDKPITF